MEHKRLNRLIALAVFLVPLAAYIKTLSSAVKAKKRIENGALGER